MTRVEYSDQILEPATVECLNRYYAGTMSFWKEKADGPNMRMHIDAWFKRLDIGSIYSLDFKHYGYHADGDHACTGKFYAEVKTTSFDGNPVPGSLYGKQDFFLLAPSWTDWMIIKRSDLQQYIESRTDFSLEPSDDCKMLAPVKSRRQGGVIVYFDLNDLVRSSKCRKMPNLLSLYCKAV